jgi:hypothetical protein
VLTPAELEQLGDISDYLARCPAGTHLTAEGTRLADQLRVALPDVADADLGRCLLAVADEAAWTDANAGDPAAAFEVLSGVVSAAALSLTFLERTAL